MTHGTWPCSVTSGLMLNIGNHCWFSDLAGARRWHCVTCSGAAVLNIDSSVSVSSSAQLVSLLLIGVAAWGKWFGLVSSISVVAGVIGVGTCLFLVAIVGLCGALKHHQVLLFFVSFHSSARRRTGSRLTPSDSCCLPKQSKE